MLKKKKVNYSFKEYFIKIYFKNLIEMKIYLNE